MVNEASRQSLDSAQLHRIPRSSIRNRPWDPPTAEEGFEDVGLNDDQKQQPKKRGFFAKFSDSQESGVHSQGTGMSRFIPGRKRAQSGQGSELGHIERPSSRQSIKEQEMQ